ncbi:UDP-N-acetylglucosamine acyltransferase [Mycolicibacterium mucogenicum 261Sha1.1M5]|nr:UDP-N-acetylglucosamine acyltransferase [Mycolicibacterium mucogenicum 261Sha1.1M5]
MSERVSPMAFIGEGVELGADVTIGPGAVILGPCNIEDNVWIGPGAQIGAPPEMASLMQNAAWTGELDHAGVRIRTGAVVREGAIIHQGTYRETTVGERSWVLNRAYLAHDVLLGADATVSAGVSVGGHCEIGDRVNIGMNAVIHQRRVIAPGAMIGMGTPVTRDVPPFAKVFGTPPRIAGINSVGLQRAGHTPDLATALQEYYVQGQYFVDTGFPLLGVEPLASQISWWRSRNGKNPPKFAGPFEEKYTSSS